MLVCNPKLERSTSPDIGSIVSSCLGPHKSIKCIVDDNTSHFVKCPLQILQDITSTCGNQQVLCETLEAHHDTFGCGSTTLLAMYHFWSKEFEILIADGYDIGEIINISRKALEHIMCLLPKIEISLKDLNSKILCKSNVQHKGVQIKKFTFSGSGSKLTDFVLPKFLMKSRHFCPVSPQVPKENAVNDSQNGALKDFSQSRTLTDVNFDILVSIVKKLCHDAIEFADILSKAWQKQIQVQQTVRFNPLSVSVHCFNGPIEKSTVVDGVLLSTSQNSNEGIFKADKKHRTLFITGDVSKDFIHLGYSPTETICAESSFHESDASKSDSWLEKCTSLLLELQISVILSLGKVDTAICDFAIFNSILIVDKIPKECFKSLVEVSNASPVTYLLDCDERNVATNLTIELFENVSTVAKSYILVKPSEKLHPLSSVILHHPSSLLCPVLEHQFGHVMSRLSLATETMSVLPGSGKTETWCHAELLKHSEISTGSEKHIFESLANGFSSYAQVVLRKLDSNFDEIWDEKLSKIEAWKSALMLCHLVLQIDTLILNGCDETTVEQKCWVDCL